MMLALAGARRAWRWKHRDSRVAALSPAIFARERYRSSAAAMSMLDWRVLPSCSHHTRDWRAVRPLAGAPVSKLDVNSIIKESAAARARG